MILLAILGSLKDNNAAQFVSCVLLFVFNSFFAIGWLGMTWLYVSISQASRPSVWVDVSSNGPFGAEQPAEIVGLRIRAPANAFSTASNWTFNFVVVMVTGPSFNNISWGTYIGAF